MYLFRFLLCKMVVTIAPVCRRVSKRIKGVNTCVILRNKALQRVLNTCSLWVITTDFCLRSQKTQVLKTFIFCFKRKSGLEELGYLLSQQKQNQTNHVVLPFHTFMTWSSVSLSRSGGTRFYCFMYLKLPDLNIPAPADSPMGVGVLASMVPPQVHLAGYTLVGVGQGSSLGQHLNTQEVGWGSQPGGRDRPGGQGSQHVPEVLKREQVTSFVTAPKDGNTGSSRITHQLRSDISVPMSCFHKADS